MCGIVSLCMCSASGLLAVCSCKKCFASILSPLSICIKAYYTIKMHVFRCMYGCDFFFHVRFLFSRFNFFPFFFFDYFAVHFAIMYSVLIQVFSVCHSVGARFGCVLSLLLILPISFGIIFASSDLSAVVLRSIFVFLISQLPQLLMICSFLPCILLFFSRLFSFRCFGHKLLVLLILATFWCCSDFGFPYTLLICLFHLCSASASASANINNYI